MAAAKAKGAVALAKLLGVPKAGIGAALAAWGLGPIPVLPLGKPGAKVPGGKGKGRGAGGKAKANAKVAAAAKAAKAAAAAAAAAVAGAGGMGAGAGLGAALWSAWRFSRSSSRHASVWSRASCGSSDGPSSSSSASRQGPGQGTTGSSARCDSRDAGRSWHAAFWNASDGSAHARWSPVSSGASSSWSGAGSSWALHGRRPDSRPDESSGGVLA